MPSLHRNDRGHMLSDTVTPANEYQSLLCVSALSPNPYGSDGDNAAVLPTTSRSSTKVLRMVHSKPKRSHLEPKEEKDKQEKTKQDSTQTAEPAKPKKKPSPRKIPNPPALARTTPLESNH